jgi:hypothetical protein
MWREREKNIMERMKTKYNHEISQLKRQITMRPKYDQFTTEKTIKKDLKLTQADLKKIDKTKAYPKGMEFVEGALKSAASFQQNRKHLENEIKRLKETIEKERLNPSEQYEMLKFNEGAYWMSILLINSK